MEICCAFGLHIKIVSLYYRVVFCSGDVCSTKCQEPRLRDELAAVVTGTPPCRDLGVSRVCCVNVRENEACIKKFEIILHRQACPKYVSAKCLHWNYPGLRTTRAQEWQREVDCIGQSGKITQTKHEKHTAKTHNQHRTTIALTTRTETTETATRLPRQEGLLLYYTVIDRQTHRSTRCYVGESLSTACNLRTS